MLNFMEPKEVEKCLDSQLWHACAGGMVQMPALNSKVFYFPQGHAEHACGPVDFRSLPRAPPVILCRVISIKFMADPESDEVFARMRLAPVSGNESDLDTGEEINGVDVLDTKPASFAKTLTQSDANNGGGFSVPRYCAETIFPRLDYTADPPVQTILAKDVHGEAWKFRHIYRGTPRRHLLTTGWSTFVNHKKLVAGDSIVFLRAGNGDLCVGIRRAKRGIGGGPESSWNPAGGNNVVPYGGFSVLLREDDNKIARNGIANGNGYIVKVRPESVIEAVNCVSNGQPFEVVYYPRAGTPEFCVKASLVKMALQIRWSAGMRFKMAFETEDSSRISWFMGTISSVQVADPVRWPDSPWRLLQVTWDEPDLLQNVKRVSPWLVELVSNIPTIHLSPFSPPRKKLRLQTHPDFQNLDGQFPIPTFPGNFLGPIGPFGCLSDTTPAGMQGARHAHYGLPPMTDLHLGRISFPPLHDHHVAVSQSRLSNGVNVQGPGDTESVSCVLTMSPSSQTSKKPSQLVLFGKPIVTEQNNPLTSTSSINNSSPKGNADKVADKGLAKENNREPEPSLETGHCRVFMESEDVGHTLDLSLLGSYEELFRKLADMFGIENSETLTNVRYRDVTGAIKQIGDVPFSDFTRTARRLTI